MAKSDKDLQDIVGDAMGNDLLGTPVKKVLKKNKRTETVIILPKEFDPEEKALSPIHKE